MTARRLTAGLVALLVLHLCGCVERRFVIDTNVPGALVTVNNLPIGPSPADTSWDYSGKYMARAVAPGYKPAVAVLDVQAKWYEVPPLDFFFEALWPFHIEDVRRYRLILEPTEPVNTDELLQRAGDLRDQGQALPYRERRP